MTAYSDIVEGLFSLNRAEETKLDLTSSRAFAKKLGNPQDSFKTIHIAGTNGKGSVASKIAEVLRLSGYRVGLYTSPHLISYRERIVINQEMISEEKVVEGLKKLFQLAKEMEVQPKFFELTTHLAFAYFAQQKVDVAIIETGLGGRLDTTNIIKPLISVITTVGFDHQEVLGESLREIAFEKGGIIKKNTPVVLGPSANLDVLRKQANNLKATVHIGKQCDDENREIASEAIELLSSHFLIPGVAKLEGLQKEPRCRFEILSENVVLDVAHNQSAFERLFARTKKAFPNRPIYLLFSISKEKDLDSIIGLFKENVAQVALFSSLHPRLLAPREIGMKLKEVGFHQWEVFEAAGAAFKTLLNGGKKHNGIILVAGSFYMMEEVLTYSSDFKFSTS